MPPWEVKGWGLNCFSHDKLSLALIHDKIIHHETDSGKRRKIFTKKEKWENNTKKFLSVL